MGRVVLHWRALGSVRGLTLPVVALLHHSCQNHGRCPHTRYIAPGMPVMPECSMSRSLDCLGSGTKSLAGALPVEVAPILEYSACQFGAGTSSFVFQPSLGGVRLLRRSS